MSRNRIVRWSAALASVLALSTVAADANQSDRRGNDRGKGRGPSQVLYGTTSSNQLVKFNAKDPRDIRSARVITGLPQGVTLRGIDFRPLTGDLYGVGTDNVVYRVNPQTAIAVLEGPAYTPASTGKAFGIDFNPVVDLIRIVSDADENGAANPDAGTLAVNGTLNPAGNQIVGAAYENSSFSAMKPAATALHVVSAATDQLFTQNPPAAGTLTMPRNLRVRGAGRIDVGLNAGFDIVGANNVGFLSNVESGRTQLYTVDVPTGRATSLGQVGRRMALTGLAAVQDQN